MPKVDVYNIEGKKVDTMELSDAIFGIEPNVPVMHQVVVAHLANRRQGTQSALTRSEVRGGGKKPYRQKGTGRARQGSTRSPQWRHGGVVFAPKPRSYRQQVNKKMRRLAIKSALSSKVQDGEILVVDGLQVKDAKTSEMMAILEKLNVNSKALVVMNERDPEVERALRNLPNVRTVGANVLNVYDILNCGKFIITRSAVEKVQEVYV